MEELYNKILENSNEELVGLYDLESHRKEVERSVRDEAIYEATQEAYNKGISQGINEEKEQTAKNMFNKGIEISLISEVTGLSIEKINELRNS